MCQINLNPNLKSNPNPNLNPNPNKKCTINRVNSKKTISDSRFHYNIFLTRLTITLPSKIPSKIPDSSLRIPSRLTQPLQHVNICLPLVPVLAEPPSILWKGLNQNPQQCIFDYSKQLTRIFFQTAYRISAKTHLILFKTRFYHSSSFDSPPIFFKTFFPSDPTLSRGSRVGQPHSFFI